MRRAALVAVATPVVMAVVMAAGCSGGDDDVPGGDEPASGSATEPAEDPAAAAEREKEIQAILDGARFTEEELGLAVEESFQQESGLGEATMSYCGDDPDPVDRQRVARSQRWWRHAQWPDADAGGYLVGVEVVYYEPGGAEATMAVFEAVPQNCPSAEFSTGTTAEFTTGWEIDGLVGKAITIRDRWTYPEDESAMQGHIVAIPAGDVVGFLYIRGHQPSVDGRVAELAGVLAEKVAEADEQIGKVR